MFSSLRQLRYPKVFRIAPSLWPKDLLDSTEKIVQVLISPQNNNQEWQKLIKEISTGLWRIQNRLEDDRNPSHEVRSGIRFLQSTLDVLEQHGVKIIDHTQQRIIGGEMLRILSYETVDHLDHDKVIETIKPTIMIHDNTIQIGEVIVGTPAEKTANSMIANEMMK